MPCAVCGATHDLEPSFQQPTEVFEVPAEERQQRTFVSADMCLLRTLDQPLDVRFFLRAVLPVAVVDRGDEMKWGVWVEVKQEQLERVRALWDAPAQADEPPMDVFLANRIPGYPDTLDLPLAMQLTGPTTRPSLTFAPDVYDHPFAQECRAGVTAARIDGWLHGH